MATTTIAWKQAKTDNSEKRKQAEEEGQKQHELELNDKYWREIQNQDKKIDALESLVKDLNDKFEKVEKIHQQQLSAVKLENEQKDEIIAELKIEKKELLIKTEKYKKEIDNLKRRVGNLEHPKEKES